MPSHPQARRLPASVYWRRRAFVGGLLAAFVFVIVGVVSDEPEPRGAATPAAGQPSAGVPTVSAEGQRAKERKQGTGKQGKQKRKQKAAPPKPVLADPTGPCEPADVFITPSVDSATVGLPVTISLALQTGASEACTFDLSSQTIALRIRKGGEREIWSNRECPGQVARQNLVVRKAVVTTTTLEWNAKRSEPDCPTLVQWAKPGNYDVAVAALGGEPGDSSFTMRFATAEEKKAKRDAKAERKAKEKAKEKAKKKKRQRAAEQRRAEREKKRKQERRERQRRD